MDIIAGDEAKAAAADVEEERSVSASWTDTEEATDIHYLDRAGANTMMNPEGIPLFGTQLTATQTTQDVGSDDEAEVREAP